MNSKKSFELGMYNDEQPKNVEHVEINNIAQGIADHCMEIMYDSVDWQIADQPFDGDDYNNLHSRVMKKAIEIMFLQTQNK